MAKITRCLIVDDEPVARDVLENHLSGIDSIKIVGKCKNAVEAFNVMNAEEVDLIFLDINMPEISGLSFAKSINKNIKVIFTTAYREYAIDGFDLQAVDYLLKPISFERLLQAVYKYLNENAVPHFQPKPEIKHEKETSFFVRADRKMVKIPFDEILFIESVADYVKIYLVNKTVVTRDTITNIEARLPQKDFIRIHRSFIVSANRVESFTNELVEIGKKQIPISRGYKNNVLSILGNS